MSTVRQLKTDTHVSRDGGKVFGEEKSFSEKIKRKLEIKKTCLGWRTKLMNVGSRQTPFEIGVGRRHCGGGATV